MSVNILKTWIFCCFLVTVTEQKLKAVNFRTLPLMSDKLTIAELPSYNLFEPYGPGTYAFGYEIEDTASNNVQFRDEEKLQNGTVRGSYGLVRPNGLVSITRYIADDNGYHSTTQTFNQNDKKPTLLTSTESPFLQMSSPSDVNFLDVPNPITISPAVAQQILEQHKIDLVTESSNVPITEIFSADDDNSSDGEVSDGIEKSKQPTQQLSSTGIQQLISSSGTSNLLSPNIIQKPGRNHTTNEKKVNIIPENNLKPIINDTFIQNAPNIFKPHAPISQSITQTSTQSISTTTANLSDDNSNEKPTPSHSSTPFGSIPQLQNIFENILPHIPQLPFPTNIVTSTTEPSTTSSNNLSDENESETSSVSTTMNKPTEISSQLTNIFENILPHIPQLPLIPDNMKTTTQVPSSTALNNLSDETESETSSASTAINKPSEISLQLPNIFENILTHLPQLPSNMKTTTQAPSTTSLNNLADESDTSITTNKPPIEISNLPPIFGFLNPENFPIFKPPSNLFPNRQENTENPTTNVSPSMDTFFDSTTPAMEPIFAIIHKNATLAPIFDDDGNHVGVQLIHNLIPSNFHIVPFFIPNNYFQSSSTTTNFPQNQNIAHDDVIFEDGAPIFVNDKFHDPLNDIDPTWKRKSFRRRKGVKKTKKRRNSNLRRRNRCSI